jgi:hypothetical protein
MSFLLAEDRPVIPEVLKKAPGNVDYVGSVKIQDALDMGNKKLTRTIVHGISEQASVSSLIDSTVIC